MPQVQLPMALAPAVRACLAPALHTRDHRCLGSTGSKVALQRTAAPFCFLSWSCKETTSLDVNCRTFHAADHHLSLLCVFCFKTSSPVVAVAVAVAVAARQSRGPVAPSWARARRQDPQCGIGRSWVRDNPIRHDRCSVSEPSLSLVLVWPEAKPTDSTFCFVLFCLWSRLSNSRASD